MTEARHPQAEHRRGWGPGWIWSIPLAAAGLVAWLVVRGLSQSGPEVTVIFPVIADLRPGDTKVKFEGLDVGQVDSVRLAPDLRHLRATLALHPDMRGHLGAGTQFWLIGHTVSLSHLSDLRALISGVSVGISPRPGARQHEYQGLAEDPVLGYGETGTALTLHAPDLGSIQRGTPIYYLGEHVGEITGYHLTGAQGFDFAAFIDAPYDRFVHAGSRFWRSGPVHLSSGGGGPSLQFQSVPALLEGAIAFSTPDHDNTPAGGRRFTLYDDQDAASSAPDAQGVAYRVVFDQASGVPDRYAPVTLMGRRVGAVSESRLEYVPAEGRLRVDATIVLEPRRVPLAGATWTDPRAQMDDMLRRLIASGLHAELAASPPVIGGQQVALRDVPGAPGMLGPGPVPEIPTSAGGGIAGIMDGVNDVVAKMDQMPLPQIADNLQEISRHIARLTNSPALAATLRHVNHASASLQRIGQEMDRSLPPALDELRHTVAEAQSALASAQDLLSAQGNAASMPGSQALPETLYEITRTARAMRELSDFLDRHPSAVLTGRAAGG